MIDIALVEFEPCPDELSRKLTGFFKQTKKYDKEHISSFVDNQIVVILYKPSMEDIEELNQQSAINKNCSTFVISDLNSMDFLAMCVEKMSVIKVMRDDQVNDILRAINAEINNIEEEKAKGELKTEEVETETKPKVLIVDDDVHFLKITCFQFSDDFDFVQFNNPERALDELKKGLEVDIILSDQQMIEMSGTDFLKESSKICPDSQRIMMTGYTNNEELQRCINEAGLYGFLRKALKEEKVIELLNDAYQERLRIIKFKEELEKKTLDLEKLVVEQRLKFINEAAQIAGYDTESTFAFQEALSQIADARETTWADAELYEGSHDIVMIDKFGKQILQVKRIEKHAVVSDIELAKKELEEFTKVVTTEKCLLSTKEYTLLYGTALLLSECGKDSTLKYEIQNGEVVISFESKSGFGSSILNIKCNRSDSTIKKNALLYHIIVTTDSLGGHFNIEKTDDGFSGNLKVTVKVKEEAKG